MKHGEKNKQTKKCVMDAVYEQIHGAQWPSDYINYSFWEWNQIWLQQNKREA